MFRGEFCCILIFSLFPGAIVDGLICFADNVCIHSIVVTSSHRRQKIGTTLLKRYINHVRDLKRYVMISLIAKENLLKFYKSCGFEVLGVSPVVHGKDQWYELRLRL